MRRLLRFWPSALALALSVDGLFHPTPQSALVMVALPVAYLVIGAVRRKLRPRWVLLLQVGGVAGYLALAGAALIADPVTAQVLVGIGWIAHAGWDVWHHRRDLVVWRAYAQGCVVFDLVIGVTAILAAIRLA